MTATDKAAVEWLKTQKRKMDIRTYRTKKKNIHDNDTQNLYDLAKAGKENQMQRINVFKVIKNQTWDIIRKSTEDDIKLRALKQARDIEPYIAAAEAAIPYIIKEVIQNFGKPGNTEEQGLVKSSKNN